MLNVLVVKLRSSSHLIKNSGWNLLGQLLPLLSALACIPVLIKYLGNEKFGFLSIAWMIIGYFSLFDFGLGRAITYAVAKKNVVGENPSLIITTAFKFLVVIGLVVTTGFYLGSEHIVGRVLNLQPEILSEATQALELLSFGLPFVILTIGLRGVLEAYQAFKKISLISIPSGTLLFVAPTIVSLYDNSLTSIFISLVIIRIIQFFCFYWCVAKQVELNWQQKFCSIEFKALLKFGSWMTVTNIVSPIMVNMDRFFIGAKLSVSVVTNYVVPFDMITKALVIPSSISGVLFPEFSKLLADNKLEQAKQLLLKWSGILFVVMLLPLLFVFIFAYQILAIWITPEFAQSSYPVLQILAIGVMFNALAYIPFAFIQGLGRSDLTAKTHLIELIFYLPLLLYFIERYGFIGAAYAWCARVVFDFIVLFFLARGSK